MDIEVTSKQNFSVASQLVQDQTQVIQECLEIARWWSMKCYNIDVQSFQIYTTKFNAFPNIQFNTICLTLQLLYTFSLNNHFFCEIFFLFDVFHSECNREKTYNWPYVSLSYFVLMIIGFFRETINQWFVTRWYRW